MGDYKEAKAKVESFLKLDSEDEEAIQLLKKINDKILI
ncbi:MAG: hypothetical protein HeimC2_13870 [Candidatus Heimdallarchaeota archaeon LC_2]|nr:MAG: hypothetical protein HeimC2_13870 [Candidatus Heimdallarchaeota archaeon LC_2]